jgi:Sugar (and other) transporter
VVQGRHQEALIVLERLHGTDSNESEDDEEVPFYKREFNQIEAQIRLEQENPQLGIVAILKRPSYRKRLFIILFFFAFQQLTAIIPLQNYQVILYTSLGIKGKIPLVLVGVWGSLGVIFACGGAYFFDKIGRRKSFFISMSGVCIGSIMLVAFWARYEASGNKNKTLGDLALWSMFVYLVGYAWVLNSFGYAYAPEILVCAPSRPAKLQPADILHSQWKFVRQA